MKKSLSEEIYPSSTIGKKIISNKMVSHYKKIYNAKPWVDTNLKKKRRQWPQRSSVPHSCCFQNCEMRDKSVAMAQRVHSCLRMKKSMSSEECTFKPVILVTPVKSKLNGLNDIYHPPRRKHLSTISQIGSAKKEYRNSEFSMKNDERRAAPETKMRSLREDWSGRQYGLSNHLSDTHETRFRPQNSLCVRFLQDITDEILNTGVYSNEALKKVFQKHMASNRYNLDHELMRKEIEHLEIALEVPINDDLNNADFGLGNGNKPYSPYKHWTSTAVDDNYVLEALESLNLHPGMKKDLIMSLDLNSLIQRDESSLKPECPTNAHNGNPETEDRAENKPSYEVIEDLLNDSELEKTSSQDGAAEELCQSLNDISEDYEETEYREKHEIQKKSLPEVSLHNENDKITSHSLEYTSISEISENVTASNSLHSAIDPE